MAQLGTRNPPELGGPGRKGDLSKLGPVGPPALGVQVCVGSHHIGVEVQSLGGVSCDSRKSPVKNHLCHETMPFFQLQSTFPVTALACILLVNEFQEWPWDLVVERSWAHKSYRQGSKFRLSWEALGPFMSLSAFICKIGIVRLTSRGWEEESCSYL